MDTFWKKVQTGEQQPMEQPVQHVFAAEVVSPVAYALGRIPLGAPCQEDVKGGKCGRTDRCGHRKAARLQDEAAACLALTGGYQAQYDEAKAKVAGVRCWAGW